jgi:hypothetical protein
MSRFEGFVLILAAKRKFNYPNNDDLIVGSAEIVMYYTNICEDFLTGFQPNVNGHLRCTNHEQRKTS